VCKGQNSALGENSASGLKSVLGEIKALGEHSASGEKSVMGEINTRVNTVAMGENSATSNNSASAMGAYARVRMVKGR